MTDRVRRVDYYYTIVANRAGQGARVLESFRDEGVNFLAVHAFPAGAKAQIDLFPEDSRAFLRAARKAGLKLAAPVRTRDGKAFFIDDAPPHMEEAKRRGWTKPTETGARRSP